MFLTALVTMPFALTTRPSLQVGLLAEIARSNGLPVDTLHLNLDLARLIGADRYHHLACTRNPMVGDWLFSLDAFGGDAPDPAGAMLEDLGAATQETLDLIAMSAAELRHVREAVVPAYLDSLVAEIAWEKYSVVAFTSTFQQNVASFALARRLKALRPDIVIVFGGANFDGPMGLAWMQAVPQIDFAISGEADRSFPALLNRLASGSDPTDVPGLLWRRDGEARTGAPAVPCDMLDDLPVPNYGEYFERSLELGLLTPDTIRTVDVPFESSRGCWWGAKATCRFCGLNGSTMTYRSKSPGKVIAELAIQAERYGSLSFNASDNIMNVDLLRSMMQPLAEASIDYRLFYEVKADLSRQDIRLMSQAGVRALQPGIESLSSHLLRLMRKGTRAATNVNLLRWARYYGVDAHWNLLYGFPGETTEDYDAQQKLVKRIPHLSPPGGFLRIGLERFSPYFEESERFSGARRTCHARAGIQPHLSGLCRSLSRRLPLRRRIGRKPLRRILSAAEPIAAGVERAMAGGRSAGADLLVGARRTAHRGPAKLPVAEILPLSGPGGGNLRCLKRRSDHRRRSSEAMRTPHGRGVLDCGRV